MAHLRKVGGSDPDDLAGSIYLNCGANRIDQTRANAFPAF